MVALTDRSCICDQPAAACCGMIGLLGSDPPVCAQARAIARAMHRITMPDGACHGKPPGKADPYQVSFSLPK
jgi:hypothetical protein